ncbi:hypothetical protein NL676_013473 [Syzygium grande]|nr:hypothetical protein NL676_013473 [Syzygium grande]
MTSNRGRTARGAAHPGNKWAVTWQEKGARLWGSRSSPSPLAGVGERHPRDMRSRDRRTSGMDQAWMAGSRELQADLESSDLLPPPPSSSTTAAI